MKTLDSQLSWPHPNIFDAKKTSVGSQKIENRDGSRTAPAGALQRRGCSAAPLMGSLRNHRL
jgi:hypothetical protein